MAITHFTFNIFMSSTLKVSFILIPPKILYQQRKNILLLSSSSYYIAILCTSKYPTSYTLYTGILGVMKLFRKSSQKINQSSCLLDIADLYSKNLTPVACSILTAKMTCTFLLLTHVISSNSNYLARDF